MAARLRVAPEARQKAERTPSFSGLLAAGHRIRSCRARRTASPRWVTASLR